MIHIPVLFNETIEALNPQPGQNFVDATFGNGGHARAIAERVRPDGRVIGIEWDQHFLEKFETSEDRKNFPNIITVHDSYVHLKNVIDQQGIGPIQGVLLDLGMSSWHVDASGKGFSFLRDEPLDMRYDAVGNPVTAAELINTASRDELIRILREYSDERFALPIVERIIQSRKQQHIITTFQLIEIIKSATPFWYRKGRTHCATKVFQALRIAVNNEFENIEIGIRAAIDAIVAGGRLAIITFHSSEDRIVKNTFKTLASEGQISLVYKKPIVPQRSEIIHNPRSRSAKLRVAEKL